MRPASESDKGEEVLDHGYVRPASESDGDEEDFYMVGDNKRWKYFNIDMKHDSKPVYKDKNNILKNVGAIGIFTHGSYYDTHTFIPLPKGLVVNEYASAPDSCYIHGPIFKEDDPYCYSLTKKAVSDLSGCMNRTEYKNAFGHLTEPNIYPELSCNLYLKVKELKGKKYSVNPVEFKIKKDVIKMDYSNIIFMVAIHDSLDDEGNQIYKKINLSLCTVDELIDFLKLTPDSQVYNEDAINDIIMDRDYDDIITTSHLVMLMNFAMLELNIGLLNILDTSCSPRPLARKGLRTDTDGYRRVMPKRDKDFIYSENRGIKRKQMDEIVPKTKRRIRLVFKRATNRKNVSKSITSFPKTKKVSTIKYKTRKHR